MRIAVMGAGGLGGFYGGLLNKQKLDVSFIARGEHLLAMKNNGLKLIGPRSEYGIEKVFATNKPEEVGIVDVVLFCVKLYDVEEASHLIKPLIDYFYKKKQVL